MLVLSRKKNESIIINNGEIQVMVVEIRGDKVRLGIDAPQNVPVHRGEVQRAIEREGTDKKSWPEATGKAVWHPSQAITPSECQIGSVKHFRQAIDHWEICAKLAEVSQQQIHIDDRDTARFNAVMFTNWIVGRPEFSIKPSIVSKVAGVSSA